MHGVCSLWTAPASFTPRRGPLIIATLAACLAARVFPELHFYTDPRGGDLAAALGWRFEHVSLALANIPPAIPRHVWAAGKLFTYFLQRSAFIHLDFDVLLFRPEVIADFDAPMLAQSPEDPSWYANGDHAGIRAAIGITEQGIEPVNCGIFGGTDIASIRDYAAESLALCEQLPPGCNGTNASMEVEQFHLAAFAHRRGIPLHTLLPKHPTREQLAAAGYVHLFGAAKHSPRWVARCEARLKRDFPEAHAHFIDGWRNIAAAA